MDRLTKRKTLDVEVDKLLDHLDDLRNVRVVFDPIVRAKPSDIGAWTYTRRTHERPAASYIDVPMLIDESSFDQARHTALQTLIEDDLVSGHAPTTIDRRLRDFRQLMDWVDGNGHSNFLSGVPAAIRSYAAYTEFLNYQIIVTGSAKPEYASIRQHVFRSICHLVFSESQCHEIFRSAIQIEGGSRISAEAPPEKKVRDYIFFLCQYIQQLEKNVRKADFPWGLELGNDFWVIRECWANGHLSARKLGVLDEVSSCNDTSSKIQILLGAASRLLKTKPQNRNKKKPTWMSADRTLWANRVIRAYLELIMQITGSYFSEAKQWRHFDSIELIRDGGKKELSSIKMRANGKEVRYAFGTQGVKILRKYLDFREWYLSDREFEYLFFRDFSINRQVGKLIPMKGGSAHFIRHIAEMSNSLPHVTVVEARKSKAVILDQLGIAHSTASDMLNHTKKVHDNHYMSAPLDQRAKEFSSFWTAAKHAAQLVAIRPKGDDELEQTVTGCCESKGDPAPLSEAPPIEPDCSTQYGCLFCQHYGVHTDEDDYHKLFSLQYVYQQVRSSYESFELADEVLVEVITRAIAITEAMMAKHPETEILATEIRKRVFDVGILTPFWERRLERYEQLGIAL